MGYRELTPDADVPLKFTASRVKLMDENPGTNFVGRNNFTANLLK